MKHIKQNQANYEFYLLVERMYYLVRSNNPAMTDSDSDNFIQLLEAQRLFEDEGVDVHPAAFKLAIQLYNRLNHLDKKRLEKISKEQIDIYHGDLPF